MIICNIIVIPRRKPRFQKEFIWRGQGYDCKWDFISNTKYNSWDNRSLIFSNYGSSFLEEHLTSVEKKIEEYQLADENNFLIFILVQHFPSWWRILLGATWKRNSVFLSNHFSIISLSLQLITSPSWRSLLGHSLVLAAVNKEISGWNSC